MLRRRVCSAWMNNSNTLLVRSSKTLLGWQWSWTLEDDQASKGEDYERVAKAYAACLMALAAGGPAVASAGDAAVQNKQCIDMAAAHQIVAGSRNARLYPD